MKNKTILTYLLIIPEIALFIVIPALLGYIGPLHDKVWIIDNILTRWTIGFLAYLFLPCAAVVIIGTIGFVIFVLILRPLLEANDSFISYIKGNKR